MIATPTNDAGRFTSNTTMLIIELTTNPGVVMAFRDVGDLSSHSISTTITVISMLFPFEMHATRG